VIASAVGGLTDFVRDGVNGLLVPPGDAYALADAIARIDGDRALADRLGEGVAETSRDIMNWDSVARRTLRFYRDLIGPARPRG